MLLATLALLLAAPAPDGLARTFSFRYAVEVPAIKKGRGPVDVFIPLASSDAHQVIFSQRITASIPGTEGVESKYGNRFWHGHLEQTQGLPIRVEVNYELRRRTVGLHGLGGARNELTKSERAAHAIFLSANARVPISGEPIDSIVKEIAPGETSLAKVAKATFDYVVDNMEYKKVASGWGNGDTYWACSQKYGNCTDFHALFTSLGRARGIPTRFQIGFPVPLNRAQGEISGYHCWAEFFLPGRGWVPADASEAKKHPKRRAEFFGGQPADRIQFSVGRDLELGAGHRSGPLNYFIYPHVEVSGKRFGTVTSTFTYAPIAKP